MKYKFKVLSFVFFFAILNNSVFAQYKKDSISKKKTLNEVGLFYEAQQTWFFFLPSPGTYISQPTYKNSFGFLFGHYGKANSGIETGLIYSNQGQDYTRSQVYNYNSQYDSTILNVKFNLSYFKVPFILRVSGNPQRKFWINLNLGLQICLLNEAGLRIEDTKNSPYNYNQQIDLKQYLKPIDLNVVGALCFNFKIKDDFSLFSGLRFDRSFINVAKSNQFVNAPPSYSSNFGIMLGLKVLLRSSVTSKEKPLKVN
jgi:hypothetical protein